MVICFQLCFFELFVGGFVICFFRVFSPGGAHIFSDCQPEVAEAAAAAREKQVGLVAVAPHAVSPSAAPAPMSFLAFGHVTGNFL